LLSYKIIVDADDDDDDDEFEDDMSIDSDTSAESMDTLEFVARHTYDYGSYIYNRFEDPEINWDSPPLKIADMSEAQCLAEFRFRKDHLQLLSNRLWTKMQLYLDGDYDHIKLENRYKLPFETCLMFLLYRLSVPRRIHPDMEKFFGIRKSKISAALITFVDALYKVALPYLSNPAIFHHRFNLYSKLIFDKSNSVNNIWGFIDGTLRKTCRPIRYQRAAYSGHKRCHGIKFQSVITPDGLIACFFGPIPGARHDSYMLAESQLLPQLEDLMPREPGVEVFALYGDPAYPQSRYIVGGYRNADPNSVEARWNTAMSKVRICVEWGFKEITQQWTFLDFKQKMKVFKFPVAKYYMVGAFLSNLRNCFYDNQTALYFKCSQQNGTKMSLDEYLGLVNHEEIPNELE
jgi:hypothetical protein